MDGDQNVPPSEYSSTGPSTSKPKAQDVRAAAPAARNARPGSSTQPAGRAASRGGSAHVQPARNAPMTKPVRPVPAPRGASVSAAGRAARPPAAPATRNVTSRAVSQSSANAPRAQRLAPRAGGVAVAARPAARYMSSTISAAAHSIKSQSSAAIPRPAIPAVRVAAPTRPVAVRAPVKPVVVAAPKPQPKAAPKPAPAAAPSRPTIRPVARPVKSAGHLQSVASMNGRNAQGVASTSGQSAPASQPGTSQVQRATKTPAAESSSSQSEQPAVPGNSGPPANQQPASNDDQDQPSSSSDVPLPPLVDIHAIAGPSADMRPGRESFVTGRPRNEQIQYFRDLIVKTTAYLTENASKWEKVLDTPAEAVTISEEGVELIRLATGQSRLFMAQKLQQFAGLVDDCEFNRGERETSPFDLAGFWDMIKMQVSGINEKFNHIETLAGNKWVAPPTTSTAALAEGKPKNPAKKSVLKTVDENAKAVKSKTVSLGNVAAAAAAQSKMREVIKQKRRELSAGTSTAHHEPEADVQSPESQPRTEGSSIYFDAESNSEGANDETVLVHDTEADSTDVLIKSEPVSAQ